MYLDGGSDLGDVAGAWRSGCKGVDRLRLWLLGVISRLSYLRGSDSAVTPRDLGCCIDSMLYQR